MTAALAAVGTFVEARCFLRAYREAVPCIFFVILELFSLSVIFGLFSLSVMFGLEPDISLTDSPVKPGNDKKEKKLGNDEKEKKPGNDEKEKKLRNDEREKKRGMTIRRGEPAMTGGRESTNTAGEKNKPGVRKRSGEKCKAKALLSLIRGFL
ncbi:MAG: hypothetical protein ACLU5H_05960 [Alphaproteobacteria bacterium]